MELYTLTPNFLRDELVEGYTSAIWTERFFTTGECQVIVPATPGYRNLLHEGKFLSIPQSKEVMLIQDHNVDKNLLTVKGYALDVILNERQAWFENPEVATEGESNLSATAEFKETTTAGQAIADALTKTVINPPAWIHYPNAQLDWDLEKIPNLVLGEIDTNGLVRERTISVGQLGDGLRSLATANGLGFRIFLDSADEDGYVLKFALWRGADRTSDQNNRPLVRLSPNLNSLLDTKEVLSIAGYSNVAYIHYKNQIYTFYAEPTLPPPVGFDRRSVVRMAEGDVPFADEAAYLAQQAADAFANNNYVRAIDGETTISGKYRYQRDYRLGDVIELEGITGLLTKARVTEYIRSSDETGEKEYPTIAVVDPLDTGNLPTLDPGTGDDFTPDDPEIPDPDEPDIPDPEPDPYPKGKRPPKPHIRPPGPGPGGGDGGDPGDGEPDPNDGGTPENPGPWTPGQPAPGIDTGPGGNAAGMRLYFMRSFAWEVHPALDNQPGETVGGGTMDIPSLPNLWMFTEVHIGSIGEYGDDDDNLIIGVSIDVDGGNSGVVGYAFNAKHGTAWPQGAGAYPGGSYNYGNLQFVGNDPSRAIVTPGWGGGLDHTNPDNRSLPDATGSVALWVYGPI